MEGIGLPECSISYHQHPILGAYIKASFKLLEKHMAQVDLIAQRVPWIFRCWVFSLLDNETQEHSEAQNIYSDL